mgnify:FL=1|tara:strand:- start:411 stop:710 length:300 start_codon:yes stop_codon:yes gene_type:complete
MSQEIVTLIQELGFPVAIAVASMGMLAWVVKYILKDKVEDTLIRFDSRHDHLLKELDEIKKEMHLRFDQERDDTEKIKKWCSEIKSDLKVYIDLTMKGK